MRLLVWILAGVMGFTIGWASIRWIAQPLSRPFTALSALPSAADTILHPVSDLGGPVSETADKRMQKIAALVAERPGLSRDHALVAAISELQPADFPAGFHELLVLTSADTLFDSKNADLAELWMDRWLEIDAPGALKFFSDSAHLAELPILALSGWPVENQSQSGFGGVLRALARREPEWTRQVVLEMDEGPRREVAIYALLMEAAKGGGTRAQALLSSFSAPEDRRGAIVGYVTGLAAADIHSAFDAAYSEAPGFTGEEAMRVVFQRAAWRGSALASELLGRIEDPANRRRYVAQVVAEQGFEGRDDVLPFVQEECIRRAAAGEWKLDLQNWVGSVEVIARGPEARALTDWAFNFAPDADRTLWAPIARSWAYRDAPGFQTWLSENVDRFDAPALDQLAPALEGMMLFADPTSARAWMETLPAGQVRDRVRFHIALSSGGTGDVLEAEVAYRALAPSDEKGELARAFTQVLLRHDLASAAKWTTTQPPGPARSSAVQLVAETLSQKDPRAAAAWLEQLAPGTERDSAEGIFATQALRADPETAAEWVGQVDDLALRTRTAKAVFDRWKIQNPVTAREWLRGLSGVEEGFFAKELRNSR